ncbi:hypothetical protein FRC00_005353 [Tulasnella sp. 408]|nr:hypothetical protein FRC00_005353 [Tulasnella sp. 408]
MKSISNAIPALPEDSMAQEELDELEDDPEAAAEANGNVDSAHLARAHSPASLSSFTYVFSPRPSHGKHGQAVKRQRSPPTQLNTKENSTSSAGGQSPTQQKRRRTSLPSWGYPPLRLNTAEDDEEDVEVVLQGPIDDTLVFSTPSGHPSKQGRQIQSSSDSPRSTTDLNGHEYLNDSVVEEGDGGYETWGGIGSSDREYSPPSSPIPAVPSMSFHIRSSSSSRNVKARGPPIRVQTSPPSSVDDAEDTSSHVPRLARPTVVRRDPGDEVLPLGGNGFDDGTARQEQVLARAQTDSGDERMESPHFGEDDEVETSTIQRIFDGRGGTPLREDDGMFGAATLAPEGYDGFATRFYPNRGQDLQIPAGELTAEALTLRWTGISTADVALVKSYEDTMHRKLPKACRDLIKGTIRANFDPEVHRWLACRIKVLSEFPERSTEKGDFIDRVVREFFYRFADLHPTNMFLTDDVMEKKYVAKIKASLRSRASELKAKRQTSSESVRKAVAAYIPFLDRALHRDTATRPSDFYFEEEGVRDMTKPLWDEHWAEVKDQLIEAEGSEEAANRFRISTHMTWRNWFFYDSGFVPEDVQNAYIEAAAAHDKSQNLSRSEIIERGLPVINNVLSEFSVRTGIPFMLAMTWPDPDDKGRLQTMLLVLTSEDRSDAPHSMYEHITPDEAAGCPEGTVPKIEAYTGSIDVSNEVKTSKSRAEVLKYIVDRWCAANHRQRANHDQIQLDINDKIPRERLPKATRSVEIERIQADGSIARETVQREVVVLYTKITAMPLADFIVWLHHLSDPDIPPENQFFFSAELRMAADAGAEIPITVRAALAMPPNSEEGGATSANSKRPRKRTARSKERLSKSRSTSSKDGQATGTSDPRKKVAKRTKQARNLSGDSGESTQEEEIILPTSDELDDLSDADLTMEATRGSRQSERIKDKGKSKEQDSKSTDCVPKQRDVVATAASGSPRAAIAPPPDHQRQFLSSVSIRTPSRRQPAAFSFSPALDRLDSSAASWITNALVKAKSQLQNLPPPDFPCKNKGTGLSAPKTIFEVLTLLAFLDHMFPNRPVYQHPSFRTTSIAMETPDPTLESAVSMQVWIPLNNPDLPIPMATTLNRICGDNEKYAEDTFDTASIYVRESIELLRRRSLLTSAHEVYTATHFFSVLCRYIVFIGRNPTFARKVKAYVNVMAEWGTVLVSVTYAVHTTQEVLRRHPRESLSSPLTVATAIPALLSSFLDSLYQYISSLQYALSHVVSGEFLFLDLDKTPCFSLSSPNSRWFYAVPTAEMEKKLSVFFSRRLEKEPATFHDMPIIGQMELLTVVCALHAWQARSIGHEEWIEWLQSLRSSMVRQARPDRDTSAETEPRAEVTTPHNSQQDTVAIQNETTEGISKSENTHNRPPDQNEQVTQPEEAGPLEDQLDGHSRTPPVTQVATAASRSNLGVLSSGNSRWRPGDRAKVIINKKVKDVEIFRQDGKLQMRDTESKKVINDIHRRPKALPDFDHELVYYRLPSNAPQKIALFHLYSTNPPPPPNVNDPATWTPFLPSDEEFDTEKVRLQWDPAPSQASSIKGTIMENGVRKPTRRVMPPRNGAGERAELPGHFKRNVASRNAA